MVIPQSENREKVNVIIEITDDS